MKLQIMSTVLLLSLTSLSFALTPKPDACPSLSAIKAAGVNIVIKDSDDGVWSGGMDSANYATKENWTLIMGAFDAKNQEDAKAQMIASLNSMTFVRGPLPFNFDGQDSWVCSYKDQAGHTAGTVTPIVKFDSLLRKYI